MVWDAFNSSPLNGSPKWTSPGQNQSFWWISWSTGCSWWMDLTWEMDEAMIKSKVPPKWDRNKQKKHAKYVVSTNHEPRVEFVTWNPGAVLWGKTTVHNIQLDMQLFKDPINQCVHKFTGKKHLVSCEIWIMVVPLVPIRAYVCLCISWVANEHVR